MKKIKTFLLALVIIIATFNVDIYAAEKEMRAAWIGTVFNQDWPKTKNDPEKQKKEYTDLLDKLKVSGINAIIVQIRPKADAIYKSEINPWSEFLTGTQGKYPGYDPLPFLIDEAHKRGMEFHAWFNPYRVTTSTTDITTLSENHIARKNPSWLLQHKNGKYDALMYDPGLPEVRKHIVETVEEVVRKYDVDGIHFDDYFYRGTGDEVKDEGSYSKYGNNMDRDDWRRENVNTLLRDVKTSIKNIDPNVKFGVSPAGIWKNKSSDTSGSDTKGSESYYKHYADSRAWIRQGLVDYIVPQIYWEIGNSVADYSKLVSWWSNEVKNTDVDLYIGQGIYKQGTGSYQNENVAAQIKQQIELNRKYSEIKGSMHFSARDIVNNSQVANDLKEIYNDKVVEGELKIKSLKGDLRYDTAVEISKEGWPSGANTVVVASANSIVDGVTATPLATTNDAPILLVDKNTVPNSTKSELLRLKPSNIIIVGGTDVIQNKVMNDIKLILPESKSSRIGGSDRYETSLLIAEHVASKNTIKTVFVASGIGEPDALSIASKAGEDKQPIILVQKDKVSDSIYNWIKGKNINTTYFIGGEAVLSNNVIEQINSITSENVLYNRIAGSTRQETNAKVIEKFYTSSSYESVLVTKQDPLVDALTAGPLAAKKHSPIVILGNSVSETQKNILKSKSTKLVYEVGGGINQSAFNSLISLLK